MAATIASTSLTIKPSDDLAVVDVYKQTSTQPVNNRPVNNATARAAGGQYRNDPSIAKVSQARAEGGIAAAVPTAIELIDRLSNLSNNARGPIANLPPEQLNEILGIMGREPNAALTSVLVEGQRYNRKPYRDVSSLTNLIVSITGNSELMRVLDLESESALFGVMIKHAINLGIPKAIDSLIDKVEDEKLKKRLLLENLELSARMSDLVTVNKVLDDVGVNKALARVPNLLNIILMFYRLPTEKNGRTFNQLKTELINTLNRIKANWHLAVRNGVSIRNLEPFTYASKDALSLLSTESTYRVSAMVAPRYKSEDLMRLIRRMYPKGAFVN